MTSKLERSRHPLGMGWAMAIAVVALPVVFAITWHAAEDLELPVRLLAVAVALGATGIGLAKMFRRVPAAIACPHCGTGLKPVVTAARRSDVELRYCVACGNPVEP